MTTQNTSLQKITVEEQELKDLANSYKSLVVTPQTLAEVDKARKVLKNKRLEIENTVKANKKSIKELLDNHIAEAERLVAIISPVEQRLLKEQKDLEEKQAAEARAKIEAEENRKRAIRSKILEIENLSSEARKTATKEELFKVEETFYNTNDNFDFQEFSEEANAVIQSFHSALESRLAFLKEQESKVVEAPKVEEPKVDIVERDPNTGNTKRSCELLDLGFKNEPHAWVKGDEVIPHSIVNGIADDAWGALLKSKVKQSPLAAKTEHVAPVISDDMNVFTYQQYKFGISKNVPFKKAIEIKAAIEKILA